MKTAVLILAVCSAVASAALALVLVGEFRHNRELRDANQKLQAQLANAQAETETEQAQHRKTASELALARNLSTELRAKLDTVEAASTSAPAGPPPVIPPLRANAFLGQKWLGQAWVLAHNVRLDTNTQRYVYDPVVSLDESLRGSFVVTNVVEREIETQTSYNYNNTYYPAPVYYVVNPGRKRDSNSNPPSWPPSNPTPYPTPPAFNPGSGTVIPQNLGTPADQIKTRPQVVGQTPAPPR